MNMLDLFTSSDPHQQTISYPTCQQQEPPQPATQAAGAVDLLHLPPKGLFCKIAFSGQLLVNNDVVRRLLAPSLSLCEQLLGGTLSIA